MNIKILLVDDAPAVLRVFNSLLGEKYEVVTASDGPSALERCREEGPFAVVISDYEMPGMTGTELLGRVREQWPDTVSILLTCHTDVDVMTEALRHARIFRFLQKLGPHTSFLASVAEAVAEYGAIQERLLQARELGRSTEVLAQLTNSLEERLFEQTEALKCLHDYASRLTACQSLQEIADVTASTVAEVCPDRGLVIELPDGCTSIHGEGPGSPAETIAIKDVVGRLGSITLCATDASGRQLTQGQREMLSSIAASAASAGHSQIRRRERDAAQQATIFALARLAEQRDNETGKHVERVSLFCKLIAEGLREAGHHIDVIDDAWINDLLRSAPLHDLGKVGIPDSILLKPGKLDEHERAIMETHCQIGADTLQRVIDETHASWFLTMSMEIAYSHHEKWDGSGYPRQLVGAEIPLSARILALADVYDALTSRRPYKEPWSHAEALAWIEEKSGTHFDPTIVETFLRHADRASEIRLRLGDCVARAG